MKQRLKAIFHNYPLARRVTFIVILGSIFFTFITSAIQMFIDYSRETRQLNSRLDQIQVIEAPLLANSLWHFDEKQIQTQLEGMVNLQDISYVKLEVTAGGYYTAGTLINEQDAISRIIDLNYTQGSETYKLGSLKVMANQQDVQQRVWGWVWRIMVISAAQSFMLAAFILLVVDHLLTRPLDEIADYTERLDLDHLEKPLTLSQRWLAARNDEIHRVALKLNEMRCRLMNDMDERKKMEEDMRRLNAELEERVKQRTEQLIKLNQELEAFSYSVAHDLRAPLRSMNGFSQIVLEDYGNSLDDEGRKYLQRIRDSAQNMGNIVDGLLILSRVTRDESNPVHFNLSELTRMIADDLQQQMPDRPVEFIITPDIMVYADQQLMKIAMENMFGNAWKFTSKQTTARIELGCVPKPQDNFLTCFVRDNGVGFDMAHAKRLFTPFERLHSASQFSGTGIGLATVRRIIQRSGGQIWAEGTPDQGASFYFTLPLYPANPS